MDSITTEKNVCPECDKEYDINDKVCSCGSDLKIVEYYEYYECSYCGSEYDNVDEADACCEDIDKEDKEKE